jgi:hypothetical protein
MPNVQRIYNFNHNLDLRKGKDEPLSITFSKAKTTWKLKLGKERTRKKN